MTENAETPNDPPPKRPWTILGRLSKAVREQNWFAVVLEVCIVIVGVVIGFQVTSWGQDRSDRVKETAYLHQLVEDLYETEHIMLAVDSVLTPLDSAGTLLLHAFNQADPPSGDSLQALILASQGMRTSHPVLGTVEALVATGDLGLIREDSLRSALTAYLDYNRKLDETVADIQSRFLDGMVDWYALVDYPQLIQRAQPPDGLDSHRRATPYWPMPATNRAAPKPFDPQRFLENREIYALVYARNHQKQLLWVLRQGMRSSAQTLREQIEAHLDS